MKIDAGSRLHLDSAKNKSSRRSECTIGVVINDWENRQTSGPADPVPVSALTRQQLAMLEQTLRDTLSDGHALIAECLARNGVTHVYSISGTPVEKTLATCAAAGIRVIGVRHQQAGVLMAAAQNYALGRLVAVNILSAGPAITNAATGILVARDNGWPLVVLGGRRPLNMEGLGSFQDLDAVSVFRPITKWSAVVERASQLPDMLCEAFRIATEGQPGPVYLDIPEEALDGVTQAGNVKVPVVHTLQQGRCDPAQIVSITASLLSAKQPLVILGKGLRWSEPYAELRQLVEMLGIPFVSSPMARGFIPDDHNLCFNSVSRYAQSRADVICVLGARLNWTFRFGAEFRRDARVIHVATHKEESGRNRSSEIAVTGDIKSILRQLLSELAARRETLALSTALYPWLDELRKRRTKKNRQVTKLTSDKTIPLSPHRLMKEIRDCISRDTICVLDGNVSMAAAQQVLPAYFPVSRFTAGTNGCMGVGVPFGMAAKLAYPERPVVVVCGDTAFGFNAMEMETAVRCRIPVIVVVVNNDGISGSLKQTAFYPADYPERVTMFQPKIRYERIVEAFGGHGEYLEEPGQLALALERAFNSGIAACINVRVNPSVPYRAD